MGTGGAGEACRTGKVERGERVVGDGSGGGGGGDASGGIELISLECDCNWAGGGYGG